jgi:Flp pilus assembly protein TadB
MPTLYGFAYAVLGSKISHTALNLVVVLLSLLLLAVVARYWHSSDEHGSSDLMFASAVAASLLTGSHMFTHDFSPLILALFLIMANLPGRTHRGLRWSLMAAVVIFWIVPIYFLFVAWHCLYLLFPVLLLLAFAALVASKYVGEPRPTALRYATTI